MSNNGYYNISHFHSAIELSNLDRTHAGLAKFFTHFQITLMTKFLRKENFSNGGK